LLAATCRLVSRLSKGAFRSTNMIVRCFVFPKFYCDELLTLFKCAYWFKAGSFCRASPPPPPSGISPPKRWDCAGATLHQALFSLCRSVGFRSPGRGMLISYADFLSTHRLRSVVSGLRPSFWFDFPMILFFRGPFRRLDDWPVRLNCFGSAAASNSPFCLLMSLSVWTSRLPEGISLRIDRPFSVLPFFLTFPPRSKVRA